MKELEIRLNPNPLVQFLKKPASEFTRQDIIYFIEENEIEMINFRYVGEDGKLKSLNFVLNSKQHLEDLLSTGERVDGSSLFSYIEAGSSDLYVIPRFKTAFVNPFSEYPTLDILCSFYTNEGKPLESAPEHILRKAIEKFRESTGYNFKAMGELEYYVVSEEEEMYPGIDQKGYHESPPFTKNGHIRKEAMSLISQCGGQIKYGHSEVGNFVSEDQLFEQQEIEFLPVDPQDAVDQLVIAKWILRMLGDEYNVNISFAPKITVGKAGSGLHIHMLLEKDGENIMIENGKLGTDARRMIAGILDLAAPLTAFGNTIPTSYLRLVPHQEAPTNICWGDRNRSVLVRVPLGWTAETSMIKDANPQETGTIPYVPGKQTVELRSGDGSADIYLFMAGIIVAAQHGLQMDNALEMSEKLYMDVNIFDDAHKDKLSKLACLPQSCFESADKLIEKREFFEKNNIFPKGAIDQIAKKLKSFNDADLSERLYGKEDELRALVMEYLHCM
ncbi:MAG: glutamine synthetase family protein [Bacteroidales bacterium]|nr:glutamine synthetase family protein [Bacteroidales bacterium]